MVDFAALGTTEEAMQKKLSKIKIKLFLHAGAAFLDHGHGLHRGTLHLILCRLRLPTLHSNNVRIYYGYC